MKDTSRIELTPEEREQLSQDDMATYDYAIGLCKQENAGGPGGGWVHGHEILKEMGWTQTERKSGHRTYVTLHKPKTLQL